MSVRNYPGRRPDRTSRVFNVVTVGLFCLTGVMFLGLGEAAPLVAQVSLVTTVAWLLFRAFDALFPGVALSRPRAARVGEDGIQAEREFLPWSEVRTIGREAEGRTLKQMEAQQREDERAHRERRSPRNVARTKQYVRVRMRDGEGHVLKPAKVRKMLKDLQATLARYRLAYDEPDSPADYRTSAESPAEPSQVVLDPREPQDVRVDAFAQLTQDEKKRVVECVADEEMRRLLSR